MSSKQDRTYTRTASDLELKYNFGQTFAEVYGLISDAQTAAAEALDAYENLDAEEMFNRLTNYGKNQAILRDTSGNIYINATYIKSGKLAAEYIDTASLEVKAANITGTLSAGQIDTASLEVDAANVTGALSAANVSINGLLAVKNGATVYGLLGASTASSGFGKGVAVCDSEASNGFLAMSTGAKMTAGGQTNQIYIVEGGAGVVVGGSYYYFQPGYFYSVAGSTLGSSGSPWDMLYADSCSCCTSDREKKNSIEYDVDEKYDILWSLLKPCTGKYNNGTSGRTHMFLIAQDVESAVEEAGLTNKDFAALIKSPKQDEEGYDYALRYEEFVPMCIRQIQKLQQRIEALEET